MRPPIEVVLYGFLALYIITVDPLLPLTNDTFSYIAESKTLEGFFSPGYPALIRLGAEFFIPELYFLPLIQAISIFVIFALSYRMFGRASVVLTALSPVFFFFSYKLLSDGVLAASTISTLFMLQKKKYLHAGIVCGLSTLIRPEALLFGLAFLVKSRSLRFGSALVIAYIVSSAIHSDTHRIWYNLALSAMPRTTITPSSSQFPYDYNTDTKVLISFFFQNLPSYVYNIVRINLPHSIAYFVLSWFGLGWLIICTIIRKMDVYGIILSLLSFYYIVFFPSPRFIWLFIPFLSPYLADALREINPKIVDLYALAGSILDLAILVFFHVNYTEILKIVTQFNDCFVTDNKLLIHLAENVYLVDQKVACPYRIWTKNLPPEMTARVLVKGKRWWITTT